MTSASPTSFKYGNYWVEIFLEWFGNQLLYFPFLFYPASPGEPLEEVLCAGKYDRLEEAVLRAWNFAEIQRVWNFIEIWEDLLN